MRISRLLTPPSGGEEVSKEEMLVEEGAHALEAARTV